MPCRNGSAPGIDRQHAGADGTDRDRADVFAVEPIPKQRSRERDELTPPDRVGIMLGPSWSRQAEAMLDRRFGEHLTIRSADDPFRAVGADIDAKQQVSHHLGPPLMSFSMYFSDADRGGQDHSKG